MAGQCVGCGSRSGEWRDAQWIAIWRPTLFRAVLTLSALCLSLPAMAAPACVPVPDMAAGMQHDAPDGHHAPDRETAVPHLCVGCVPVGDWLKQRVAEPIALTPVQPAAAPAVLAIGRGAPPALPPPRNA